MDSPSAPCNEWAIVASTRMLQDWQHRRKQRLRPNHTEDRYVIAYLTMSHNSPPDPARPTSRRFPLAAKLTALTGTCLLGALGIAILAMIGIDRMHQQTLDVARCQLPATRHIMQIDMNHDGLMGCVYRAIVAADSANATMTTACVDDAKDFAADFAEHLDAMQGLPLQAATKSMVQQVRPLIERYASMGNAVVQTAATRGGKAAREQLDAFQQAFDDLATANGELSEQITRDAATASDAAVHQASATYATLLWTATLTLLGTASVSWWLVRGLCRRTQRLAIAAGHAARGDFTQTTMAGESTRDEISDLGAALEAMRSTLQATLAQVQSNANSGLQTAGSMAEASRSMATRACQQASGIEEISASMREISTTIANNQRFLDEVRQIAKQSSGNTADGRSQMTNLAEAMTQITNASSEVSKVIRVINDIAFQTNLLALNAAVEAARAGEAGKGFAVVADEVRSLAQRAAEAARETAQLVEESHRRANLGASVTTRANAAFAAIDLDTSRLAGLLDNMVQAATEITSQTEAIDGGLQGISLVTQEAAKDADDLSRLAVRSEQDIRQLAAAVGNYRT